MPTTKKAVVSKDKQVAVGTTKGSTFKAAGKLNLLAKAWSDSDGTQIGIYVQVLDEDGDPKTSLGSSDFKVWRGAIAEPIDNFAQPVQALPGLYVLSVRDNFTQKGHYVYGIKVGSRSWTLVDVVKL